MRFERAGAEAVLNVYLGRKGLRVVPAGRDGDLLASDVGQGEGAARTGEAPGDAGDPFGLGVPRIGADESGKGDWFGPLVVAAVLVDAERVRALRALGVEDSKRVADSRARALAERIASLGGCAVESLSPAEYNARYATIGNLNVLLAGLHASCIRRLLENEHRAGRSVPVVFVDRFASSDRNLKAALRLPAETRLVTAPRAEADPAVAAASLLARAAFLDGLDALGHEYGATFAPGAGPPVLRAGVDFVRSFGPAGLPNVAKMHFATTAQVMQRAR